MIRNPSGSSRLSRSIAVGLSAVVATCLTGCASSHPARHGSGTTSEPPLGFRSLPSFLPSTADPVDRVVTATAAHPQLAVQGVGVRVVAATGSALVTVTGPQVPPFVAPPPPQVTATFTITVTHVTGSVPITASAFSITDQLGRTFHPAVPVTQKAPAAAVAAGHTETFQLSAVMPTGEGRIYWAPGGVSPIVGWDFIVEND